MAIASEAEMLYLNVYCFTLGTGTFNGEHPDKMECFISSIMTFRFGMSVGAIMLNDFFTSDFFASSLSVN